MRAIALWLLLGASLPGQTRYARLGEIEGVVEVQIHPSEGWRSAQRNTPLLESSWVRTGSGSHAEIELDEGSVLRLTENSLFELADYTRLSTGQRITHLSVDRGVAYFAGESDSRDALVVSMPSAQISVRHSSRVRIETGADASRIAVIEGEVRFSSAVVELTLAEGKMLKLDLTRSDKFYLLPEIAALDSDTWSRARDKLLAASRGRLPGLPYGVQDLDANGEWIDTAEFGMAWKPRVPTDWVPFRDGKWQWYDGLGFTWIGAEGWGWAPYHYGRWMLQPTQGWIWTPGSLRTFKAGDVYWMRGNGLMGWGPLAPGENWSGAGMPALYLKSTTTFARYAPSADLREVDPAGFDAPPREPLSAAAFSDSPGPPRLSRGRLAFVRDPDRAGLIRLSPAPPAPPQVDRTRRPELVTRSAPPPSEPPRRVIVEQPVAKAAPAPEPIVETFYATPIYTGIVIMNPPEKKLPPKKRRGRPGEDADSDETETAPGDLPVPRPREGGRQSR